MIAPPPPSGLPPLPAGLAWRRRLARAVLLFERVWPALWPALGLAGLFLCAALLDVLPLLPAWLHALLLVAGGLGFIGLLAGGLRRVSAPGNTEADRRLERASGLAHRPLAVFSDRSALAGGEALWRAHVARAAAQIGRLRVGLPQPGLAARDRYALRGGLVVALVACFGIAGADAPLRLARAVQPAFPPQPGLPPTQIQAWITPPGYTGLAPLFLAAAGGTAGGGAEGKPVSVPAGSHLTVNVTGGVGAPSLSLNGGTVAFRMLGPDSYQADRDLSAGGRLAVRRGGGELGAWELTVVADRAPEVRFPEPPGAATRGRRVPLVRLPWEVSHDYGVVSLKAELHLRARPQDKPVIVEIPLPGGAPKSARGVQLEDLTANPWAGLPVTARLLAADAAGLVGESPVASFDLPERRFRNPVAQALMLVRKMLALKPEDRPAAMAILDHLAGLDDVWKNDPGGFLNLAAVGSLLYRDTSPDAVGEAQLRMWELALHLEEGATEQTARVLAEARQSLREALDAQRRGDKIDPAEIDRRMKALQDALARHLQALAEQAKRDPNSQPFDAQGRPLDAQAMQRKAEQMRDAARQGKMDEARRDMAQLDRMLQALQNARPGHRMTQAERQRAQQRQQGRQQMSVLQDIVGREGGLLDRSQSRLQDAMPPADQRDPLLPLGQAPPPATDTPQQDAARKTDQTVQQALRRALGELMQQYGDLTGKVPENIGDADIAMQDAAQALAQGRDDKAGDAEQRAIAALQKGGQSMSAQMAQQFGQGQNGQGQDGQGQYGEGQDGEQYGLGTGNDPGGDPYGEEPGGGDRGGTQFGNRQGGEQRDPLGRRIRPGTSGAMDSSDVRVPEQMEKDRARAIQEELRKRGADRSRPQSELDYIDRLLQQF
jgi:uncharacterized protein (TIGR02302 family)